MPYTFNSSTAVIAIAEQHVGEPFGTYSLLNNNCEHFATTCKTGMSRFFLLYSHHFC